MSTVVATGNGTFVPVLPCVATPPTSTAVATTTFGANELGVGSETDVGTTTYFTRDPRGVLLDERTPLTGPDEVVAMNSLQAFR